MQHSGRKMHYNDFNLLRKFKFKTDICHFGYPRKTTAFPLVRSVFAECWQIQDMTSWI